MIPTMISAQNNTIPIHIAAYPHPLMSWSYPYIIGTEYPRLTLA